MLVRPIRWQQSDSNRRAVKRRCVQARAHSAPSARVGGSRVHTDSESVPGFLSRSGGVFTLAIVIAATGWLGFENVASTQRSIMRNAIPTMREAQSLAQVNAGIVASSGRLARAASDQERAEIENFLATESNKLSELVDRLTSREFDRDDMENVAIVVKQITDKLLEQNELVRRRIHLHDQAAALSGDLLEAADQLTELSESLVANAASGATATSVGLYDVIETAKSPELPFQALDRLIEVDLDGMERMFELRVRSARVASFVAQLNREVRPPQISELEGALQENLDVLARRLADINDPGRQAQAATLLDVIVAATSREDPESLFSLRLAELEAARLINERVAENTVLAESLTAAVSTLVERSGQVIDLATARAEGSLRSSRRLFLSIAAGTAVVVLVMFWFFLQRSVIRRLRQLEFATRAIAAGDLSRPAFIDGNDELAEMGAALEVFRDNAVQKQTLEVQLRRHQQELEQLVGERTRQLEETNERLAETVEQHAAARERAEEASTVKTAFLATMSHELRTPVSGMLGMAQLLEEAGLDAGQQEYVHALRTAGNSLLNIVNDILDMSKFESGGVRLDNRPFDLQPMVVDLVALMRSPAEKKGLELSYAVDPDLETVVVGDEDRVRQVLTNLLSNATKFTDSGQIELSLESGSRHDAECFNVLFTVTDTGVGIPNSLQESIFEPFTQVDASTSRRQGGTGLGLAISRRLVEAMGGSIAVVSEKRQGTEFRVEIPFRPAPDAVIETRAPSDMASRLAPITVLLVEDDDVNRMVTKRFLEREPHRVIEASSGLEALRLLENRELRPDVILMDIGLPGMDGLETVRQIRALRDGRFDGVPVIAMSAHVFREEIDEYLNAGMDGYIGKPFACRELMETLAGLRDDRPPAVSVPSRRLLPQIVDSLHLRQDAAAIGASAVDEIVELFLSSSQESLRNFAAAVNSGEWKRAAAVTHRLKGSAASLGLEALRAESGRLESRYRQGEPVAGEPEGLSELLEATNEALRDAWIDIRESVRDPQSEKRSSV